MYAEAIKSTKFGVAMTKTMSADLRLFTSLERVLYENAHFYETYYMYILPKSKQKILSNAIIA